MGRAGKRDRNLLELKPKRNVEWEERDGRRVVLHAPRFRGAFLGKWLVPLLPRPTFRISLDAFGSFVWLRCDGNTSVADIGNALRAEFGPDVEPLYERIAAFLRKLEREDLLSIRSDIT
jgi:hypothetical protein